MADKLIVRGLDALNGEYDFDLAGMLTIGHPEQLTNREGHRVKVMSDVRAGELADAFEAGDNDVLIAFAAIILTRHGKRVDEEKLWDAPMGSGLEFIPEEPAEEVVLPPVDALPLTEANGTPSGSGGASSSPTSEPPVSDPSPIGRRASETPTPGLVSVRVTSPS